MPALYYHMGIILEKKGQLFEAESYYSKALNKQPGFIQALNALCRVLMQQKKYSAALEMLKKRASRKPVNVAVFYDIARIYSYYNNVDGAISWMEKCFENGFRQPHLMDQDPMFENLRGTPAYQHFRDYSKQ